MSADLNHHLLEFQQQDEVVSERDWQMIFHSSKRLQLITNVLWSLNFSEWIDFASAEVNNTDGSFISPLNEWCFINGHVIRLPLSQWKPSVFAPCCAALWTLIKPRIDLIVSNYSPRTVNLLGFFFLTWLKKNKNMVVKESGRNPPVNVCASLNSTVKKHAC